MKNNYFKTLIPTLFILFCTFALQAQTTKFERLIGGKSDDRSYSMTQTKDGGYILTGYTASFGAGGTDAYLIKTDGLGKVQWSKAYGTTGDETGWKVKQTADSGYIIAGTTSSKKGDGMLIKTKEDGTVVWTVFFNSDSTEDVYNVLESRISGDFYVTGVIKTYDTLGTDAFISKFSSSGNFIWQRRFGAAGNEEGYAIVEELNGNIAVVGVVVDDTITVGGKLGAMGDEDFFIARFDSKGNNKWIKHYGSAGNDQIWDIKYNKGQYIMAGWGNTGPGTTDALLTVVDTAGKILSAIAYGGGSSSKAFSIIINPDDTYSLTGYFETATNGRDAFYLNVKPSGPVNTFNLMGGTSSDGHWPSEVVRTIDGGFTIFTSSNSYKASNSNDLYLIRMDDKGVSQCNQNPAIGGSFGYNLTAGNFGKISGGAVYNKVNISTTNISSTFDSVLCCKLQAQVVSSSLTLCIGEGARIGKPAIPGYVYKWTQIGGSYSSTEASPLIFPTGTATYKLVVSSSDGKCMKDSANITLSLHADLKDRNFVRDTFFCAGDTIQVSARSGMIDYVWKGKKTDLNGRIVKLNVADTIILTVTNTTTCKYKDTLIVTQKKLPVFSLGNDTTICDNTKITLSGPASMKSYSWNSGQATTRTFTTSEEKTHTLNVVDNFGCKYFDNKVIFNKPSSSFTLGPDTVICKGINYTISSPSASALSNFFWNGVSSFTSNKTVNAAGTYILEASNTFGCKYSDTIVIGLKPDPKFSLGPDGGVCASGGRVLKGPSNLTYLWDDNSTDSTYTVFFAGSYWLKVTGPNGCVFADTIKLTIVNNPKPELGNDTTFCEKDSIYIDAGSYVSFKWNNGSTVRVLKVKTAGLYEVEVTDNNGCKGSDDKSVKTKFCLDNITYAKIPGLKVYPNPAKDKLNIEWLVKFADAHLTLYDINGKMLYSIEGMPGLGHYQIDVSQYSRGVYYLKISTGKTEQSLKVVLD